MRAFLPTFRKVMINQSQTAVLQPSALFGLGWVGKTQIATEYAHQHRGDHDLIWWITAEFRRSLAKLADDVQIAQTGDTAEAIRRVLEALVARDRFSRWLLVYDNAGEPSALAGPPAGPRAGHVLVTTRERGWDDEAQAPSIQAGVFGHHQSITLLQQRSARISAQDAETVADLLGHLPISLAQAAARHSDTDRTAAEYLSRYQEQIARRPAGALPAGYERAAAASMTIVFDQLETNFGGPRETAAVVSAECSPPQCLSAGQPWCHSRMAASRGVDHKLGEVCAGSGVEMETSARHCGRPRPPRNGAST